MAHLVETAKVDINLLLSPDKRQSIEQELLRMQGKSLGEIKQALGAGISYGEIKLVQAHLKTLASSPDPAALGVKKIEGHNSVGE